MAVRVSSSAVAFVFILAVAAVEAMRQPSAKISTHAKVRGFFDRADNGRIFRSFTRIPYAKPPVGSRRFKAPEANEGWKGTLNATEPSPWCLQRGAYFSEDSFIGREDCLYLNVFTPMLSRKYRSRYPVMVFIHGPTFFSGTSSIFRPHRLLSHDVILVTFNYRLGPLGFLSTGDENAPGNYGLLDQATALRWVNRHISAFGGDPTRVTLFGQGAGAQSVVLHLLSPLSRDLFHAAIIQSDSPLCRDKNEHRHPMTSVKNLARRVRCPVHETTARVVECLRNSPSSSLFDSSDLSLEDWTPVVDNYSSTPFTPDDPSRSMIKSASASRVPVMMGVAQGYAMADGPNSLFGRAQRVNPEDENDRLASIRRFIEFVLFTTDKLPGEAEKLSNLVRSLSEEYFGRTDENLPRTLAELLADSLYNPCVYQTALLLAERARVWFYSFEYVGNISFANGPRMPPASVFWDDLLYLFRVENYGDALLRTDEALSEKMTFLWSYFAKYHRPIAPGDRLGISWDEIGGGRVPYLRIDDHLEVKSDFRREKMEFWMKRKFPHSVS